MPRKPKPCTCNHPVRTNGTCIRCNPGGKFWPDPPPQEREQPWWSAREEFEDEQRQDYINRPKR